VRSHTFSSGSSVITPESAHVVHSLLDKSFVGENGNDYSPPFYWIWVKDRPLPFTPAHPQRFNTAKSARGSAVNRRARGRYRSITLSDAVSIKATGVITAVWLGNSW